MEEKEEDNKGTEMKHVRYTTGLHLENLTGGLWRGGNIQGYHGMHIGKQFPAQDSSKRGQMANPNPKMKLCTNQMYM